MIYKRFVILGLCAACVTLVAAQDATSQSTSSTNEGPFQSITEAVTNFSVNPLSTFGEIVNAAGLQQVINDPSLNATILAPSNYAWTKFFNYTNIASDQVMSNQTLLQQILQYHVIPGVVLTTENATSNITGPTSSLPTLLQNDTISVRVNNESLGSTPGMSSGESQTGSMLGATSNLMPGQTENSSSSQTGGMMSGMGGMPGSNGSSSTQQGSPVIKFMGATTEPAEIVYPDIIVGQSVIHVVDDVLIPASLKESLMNMSQSAQDGQNDQNVQAASGGTGGGRKLLNWLGA